MRTVRFEKNGEVRHVRVSAYALSPETWRERHAAYLTAKPSPSQIKCIGGVVFESARGLQAESTLIRGSSRSRGVLLHFAGVWVIR